MAWLGTDGQLGPERVDDFAPQRVDDFVGIGSSRQPVDERVGAVLLEAPPDLVELLVAVAHDPGTPSRRCRVPRGS